ncbi:MAG: hypothetical protein ACRD3L_13385 [Terriglobales bacterium]
MQQAATARNSTPFPPCSCMGLRMQQAWGVGLVIARDTGSSMPTSIKISSSLAV